MNEKVLLGVDDRECDSELVRISLPVHVAVGESVSVTVVLRICEKLAVAVGDFDADSSFVSVAVEERESRTIDNVSDKSDESVSERDDDPVRDFVTESSDEFVSVYGRLWVLDVDVVPEKVIDIVRCSDGVRLSTRVRENVGNSESVSESSDEALSLSDSETVLLRFRVTVPVRSGCVGDGDRVMESVIDAVDECDLDSVCSDVALFVVENE